jgi:hypothetical protein
MVVSDMASTGDESASILCAIQELLGKNGLSAANVHQVEGNKFFLGEDLGTLTIAMLRDVCVLLIFLTR